MPDPKLTQPPDTSGDPALIVLLASSQMLARVGGKAANLGKLLRADFPVPAGFCLTTRAYALVAAEANLKGIFEALNTTSSDDRDQLSRLAASARAQLAQVSVPASVDTALRDAYRQMTEDDSSPVAVRSSATAEDLPSASFAGQQDTYLNVIGIDAVLEAVRRCWESLWSERAVVYRASKAIDPRTVQLAVIVQQMVKAEAAGVLFTANPVTGNRRQAVIDASFGLGEGVVSGLVNPDHFVVNRINGEIIERRRGDKRLSVQPLPEGGVRQETPDHPSQNFSLSDAQIAALTQLGQRVEAHFGSPQDIEWALDIQGVLWLTSGAPDHDSLSAAHRCPHQRRCAPSSTYRITSSRGAIAPSPLPGLLPRAYWYRPSWLLPGLP